MMKTLHKVLRFWSRHVSMRARLTIWHLLLMGAILTVYTEYIIRERVTYSLVNQADTALELAAIQLREHIGEEDGRLVFIDTVDLHPIDQAFDVYLLDHNGAVRDSLGNGIAPLLEIQADGFTTIEEPRHEVREDEWRIYTQRVILPDSTTTGWLQIAQVLDYNDELLKEWMFQIMAVVSVMFLLTALGGLFLSSRALKPIEEIAQTAQLISTSDLEKRILYDGPNDEIGRLVMTFNNMLNRLQAGFEREQQFTTDAAHELRTPLTALKGWIDVTLSQPRQPKDYVDALHNMESQVDRLISLSNDLLFLARMPNYKQQELPEDIELGELFEVLLDWVQPLTEEKKLTLKTSIPPNVQIRGKPALIIRLLLNLLDNAIKYTPAGGEVRVKIEQDKQQVYIHINDTGPGISAEHLSHLFDRFYRIEGDRGRQRIKDNRPAGDIKPGGAGLGLSIAQEIAHAHGGLLTVESQVGEGSTFTLCLPVYH